MADYQAIFDSAEYYFAIMLTSPRMPLEYHARVIACRPATHTTRRYSFHFRAHVAIIYSPIVANISPTEITGTF